MNVQEGMTPFSRSLSQGQCSTDNFQKLINLPRLGQGHRTAGKGASCHDGQYILAEEVQEPYPRSVERVALPVPVLGLKAISASPHDPWS